MNCESECDCGFEALHIDADHAIDCHSQVECDGEHSCDKHADEEMRAHLWLAKVPLSSVTGVMGESERQDMRDAGRGHLLP